MGRFSDDIRDEISSYGETEWKGTLGKREITLTSRPITPADMQRISRAHPRFTSEPTLEGMIDLIILKVTDENGERAFDRGDKPMMMRMGSNKIGEIFAALYATQLVQDDDESFEERVKN
jgi:hypothetical protein